MAAVVGNASPATAVPATAASATDALPPVAPDAASATAPGAPAEAASYVVLCGSPRMRGRSAHLARELSEELAARHPHGCVVSLSVADAQVHGCIGCDACRAAGACVFDDDMASIREALDGATELYLASPVYFAGAPSQLKAVLDRLQPYYWLGTRRQPKRPAHLHVVGEGGDPHGFEPLVTTCRSALAVAGFELQDVTPHIGPAADADAPGKGE